MIYLISSKYRRSRGEGVEDEMARDIYIRNEDDYNFRTRRTYEAVCRKRIENVIIFVNPKEIDKIAVR